MNKNGVYIKTTGYEIFHFIIVLSRLADSTKSKRIVIFRRKTTSTCNFENGVFIYVHEKR